MTPLFGPKPAPPGLAFGPGYGEHQPGGRRAPLEPGRPAPRWQASPWFAGWPSAPLDPYGQIPSGQAWFGGYRR